MTRICRTCENIKNITEFSADKHRKDGIRSQCKECGNKYHKEYRKRPKSLLRKREITKKWKNENPTYFPNHHQKRTYGITLEEKFRMIAAQDFKCAICRKIFEENEKICTAHDHEKKIGDTNYVRGFLCHGCNVILGNAQDKISILLDCIEYLKKYGKTK